MISSDLFQISETKMAYGVWGSIQTERQLIFSLSFFLLSELLKPSRLLH